ncbi:ferrous iron transport protein A [Dethiosulfatibacter aminovorans DSM 17477]|uniref:Ferrous iron transport protein A n=1 Tax=Dethiosulfatibacter aminovorans DSM 17477 TaxID=1121476 RepID=A0A1M6IRY6_9FIRM|nr:ferrous iron transport protein A [Dethiosulfatibacter aminovorans DSM 17477]
MAVSVSSMRSIFNDGFANKRRNRGGDRNLTKARVNRGYSVKRIDTDDDEMKDFLFTLGCYEGESITIISILADNYVVSIKDARYSIDRELAEAIIV